MVDIVDPGPNLKGAYTPPPPLPRQEIKTLITLLHNEI